MNKRTRFVLVSLIMAAGLGISQLISVDERLSVVLVLAIAAYILSIWVLFEDIKGIEWVTLMILPVLFTISSGLFVNYLPSAVPKIAGLRFDIGVSRLLADVVRVGFIFLYACGMYAILLTENIFSVASIRTIQLLRAARSVGFILSLVVGLFFFTTLLSLKLPFYLIGVSVFIVSTLLSIGGLWAVDLKNGEMKEIYLNSLIVGWLMAQAAMVLAFWPVKALMGSLMLIAGLYTLLGIFEQRMTNRVFVGNYLEYVVFSLVVLITGFLTTSWRG